MNSQQHIELAAQDLKQAGSRISAAFHGADPLLQLLLVELDGAVGELRVRTEALVVAMREREQERETRNPGRTWAGGTFYHDEGLA